MIEAELEAYSIHELVVRYDAKQPSSYMPPDIHYAQDPARLEFDFEMSDLYSGRYLEQRRV